MTYTVNCKRCGELLLKSKDNMIALIEFTIKCRNCDRIVKSPEETKVTLDKPL